MARQPEIAEVIRGIQSDVTTIVRSEIELAKAELMPQAKSAGIGAGLFGGAAYLAVTGLTLLLCGFSFWLATGLEAWFALGMLTSLTIAFMVVPVVLFLIAGVLALIGRSRFQLTGPEATLANAELSIAAVKDAVRRRGRRSPGAEPGLQPLAEEAPGDLAN